MRAKIKVVLPGKPSLPTPWGPGGPTGPAGPGRPTSPLKIIFNYILDQTNLELLFESGY